ncbi:HalOD1 output domain-containing protein [Natrialbaceae archaeon A-gly3]
MTSRASSTETAVSTKVVQRVATLTDQEVLELPPLYETIDPEALDAIINSTAMNKPSLELRFTYCGCHITITGSGAVRIKNTTYIAD